MLKDFGMSSKDELNQFVTKFDKAPKAAPGAGREIEVKPGKSQAVNPSTKLPDLAPNHSVSSKVIRERGGISQDSLRGNNETTRFAVPKEFEPGFNAFKNSLNRSKTLNPSRAAAAEPGSK
jgi:hypothetical protein